MYASLELSKELYEKSGWDNTDFMYGKKGIAPRTVLFGSKPTPAYELGYLLRKLPFQVELEQWQDGTKWIAAYNPPRVRNSRNYGGYNNNLTRHSREADTPEDAAAKLCILLINQGILPVEELES